MMIAVSVHLNDDSYFPDGLALSRSQLYRKIKAISDDTLSSLVMRTRLHRARGLLSEGTISVKEVALDCGFADSSYFARSFHAEYGENPSDFLRKHKK